MEDKNTLVIMRGLPGAGKSTYAAENFNSLVISADDWFMTEDGEYDFRPWEIGRAHEDCKLRLLKAMQKGLYTIVLDNTHTQWWEAEFPIAMAEAFGYKVKIIDLFDGGCTDEELAARTSHGVPLDKITAMRGRWELFDA